MSRIKWDTLCLERENGGFGVRRLKEFNISLLRKWVWRVLHERENLWYKVLGVRYGEEGGRLSFEGRVGSEWWENLKKIRTEAGLVNGWWLVDNISH